MAEKENKDDNKKSEKKFQFNLKKMVLIPLAGIISISITIFLALFIAGRFVGVGPLCSTTLP